MQNARWFAALFVVGGWLVSGLSAGGNLLWSAESAQGAPSHRGLLALYDFGSDSGPIVKDRSGLLPPLDLRISDIKAVRRSEGSLEVRGKTLIQSDKATRIGDAVRRSGEIAIEAWIHPAKIDQEGPARIVTLSKNTSERNFTLGQERNQFDVRLRTTKTSGNGIPSVSSPQKSLATKLTHVVFTRDRQGKARLYLNGQQVAQQGIAGDMTNWDASFRLALANELTGDRPWLGTYHLVAIYDRSLSPEEVAAHFRAGSSSDAVQDLLAQRRQAQQARLFETHIAPLLVRNCFECHDATTKKGGLDLSRKVAALAGGESGRVIEQDKKAASSLLWQSVEENEMPKDRTPLTDSEKQVLRKWIDEGAVWTADVIDPAIYAHDRRAASIWIQRLTVPEYVATVRSAVGVEVEADARRLLPPDVRADGFSNTAYNLNIDLKHVEAYARLAEIIVERMDVEKFALRFSDRRELDERRMRELVSKMGKWILRGPLQQHEVDSFLKISSAVAEAGGDYKEVVSFLLVAMLQSPRFIYRMENQQAAGPAGQYEIASRMSYIIWGGPPDEPLLNAADAGELANRGMTEAQIRRMLQDPRAVEQSVRFLEQWLHLSRLETLRPDPKRFPKYDAQLAADMREETLAFFKEVAWKQQRPLAELFNAQVTFVTPRLAQHYGLEPRGKDQTPLRYDLSSVSARGGLLTQGSVLTVGGNEASMVARGLFVLHDVLRGTVKDPPPCVDTTPVPTKAGLTQRGIAEGRIANKACGGCHVRFEPLAFGLERFDGLGAYSEKDKHGNKLRDDGAILFPGDEKPISYKSSAELMDLLAGSGRVRETITWKLTQFALGRPLSAADAPIVKEIHQSAQAGGGTYAALITAIVTSDLVQNTQPERQ